MGEFGGFVEGGFVIWSCGDGGGGGGVHGGFI